MNVLNELIYLVDNEYSGLKEHKPCMDYLTNLKRIEDELGIDLITLFKVLSNKKIYFIDDTNTPTEIRCDEYLYITENNINKCYLEVNGNTAHIDLYFKDYGKTWALTKEELEKWV